MPTPYHDHARFLDHTDAYQARLDSIERAGRSRVHWGPRLGLFGVGAAAWWALYITQGPTTLLGLLGVILILWACWPGRRPVGKPIPPKCMRRLLRRGRAYVSDEHHILATDGVYAYDPQTGMYALQVGAVDPLVARQWVREYRSERFWNGMLQGAWIGFLWRH